MKSINLNQQLVSVELVTQETKNSKSFIGSATAGVIGGAVLGPIGALAGVLAGGNKQKTNLSFMGTLRDGTTFMVTGSSNIVYQKLLSIALKNQQSLNSSR